MSEFRASLNICEDPHAWAYRLGPGIPGDVEVRSCMVCSVVEVNTTEHDQKLREAAAARVRRLLVDEDDPVSIDQIDLAARLAEDRHTVSECSNSRCTSPIYNLHCFECDDTDQPYGANHIREHAQPEDLARFDRPVPEGRLRTGTPQLATYGLTEPVERGESHGNSVATQPEPQA